MVPSRYNILTHAYRALLPSFPDDLYPIVLQAVLDHDIGSSTVRIPDFSRSVISFPFVDMLGDNYTSFRIGPAPLISDNPVAVAGAAVYGPPLPEVGNFDPSCDGYRFVQGTKNGEIMFDGYSGLIKVPGQSPVVRTRFTPISNQPYPIEFYKNVTNQPSTGTENGKLCDNFISLFNSTATTGKNAPVPVKGSVTLKKPLLQYEQTFADVYGLKLTLAFIENNYLPCPKLQGYGTT
ncbi:MAG: hypothetical protein MMC23_001428 [Stictis urceolatum]|nr:hypothetical protein [Stictis urceolata]